MKTTLDIPEEKFTTVQSLYGLRTKREAVILALDELARRYKIERLVDQLGTFADFMTQDDLREMRDLDITRDISLN
jgi:Arc/MetJ family transcription regulator